MIWYIWSKLMKQRDLTEIDSLRAENRRLKRNVERLQASIRSMCAECRARIPPIS